jgi:hypothetical protein
MAKVIVVVLQSTLFFYYANTAPLSAHVISLQVLVCFCYLMFNFAFNSTVQLNAVERADVQFQSCLNCIEQVCFLFTNAVEYCKDDEL